MDQEPSPRRRLELNRFDMKNLGTYGRLPADYTDGSIGLVERVARWNYRIFLSLSLSALSFARVA